MTGPRKRLRVFGRPLCLNGVTVPRGEYLTDTEELLLDQSRNGEALRSSFLREEPVPPGWQPRPRSTAAAQPLAPRKPAPPAPWIMDLASTAAPGSHCMRLAQALAATARPLSTAMDLVPADMIRHATAEYAQLPKILPNGQRTGAGHFMRSTEGFTDYVRTLAARAVQPQGARAA